MTLHDIFSALNSVATYITISGGVLALIGAALPLIEIKLRPVEVVLIARIERPPDDSPIMMNDVDWVQHEWEWGKETMLFELPSRPAQSWRIFYAQRDISPLATEIEPLGNLPGLTSKWSNVLTIHEESYYLWHIEDDASFQKIRVSR